MGKAEAQKETQKVEDSKPSKGGFVVAPGKSLLCRKGILKPGSVVEASFIAEGKAGQDRLKSLAEAGVLKKS